MAEASVGHILAQGGHDEDLSPKGDLTPTDDPARREVLKGYGMLEAFGRVNLAIKQAEKEPSDFA